MFIQPPYQIILFPSIQLTNPFAATKLSHTNMPEVSPVLMHRTNNIFTSSFTVRGLKCEFLNQSITMVGTTMIQTPFVWRIFFLTVVICTKKLSVLLNVNITVSTIKQAFNQGGRKVSIKWCNHLDKKK